MTGDGTDTCYRNGSHFTVIKISYEKPSAEFVAIEYGDVICLFNGTVFLTFEGLKRQECKQGTHRAALV